MACGQLEFVGVKQDYLQMHKPQNLKQSGRRQGADGGREGRGRQQKQARKTIFTQFQERKIAQTGGSSSSSKINVNKASKSTRATATTRRTTRTSTTGSAISSTQGSKAAGNEASREQRGGSKGRPGSRQRQTSLSLLKGIPQECLQSTRTTRQAKSSHRFATQTTLQQAAFPHHLTATQYTSYTHTDGRQECATTV